MHVVDLSHVLLASHFPRGDDLYGGRESFWLCYVRTPPNEAAGAQFGKKDSAVAYRLLIFGTYVYHIVLPEIIYNETL